MSILKNLAFVLLLALPVQAQQPGEPIVRFSAFNFSAPTATDLGPTLTPTQGVTYRASFALVTTSSVVYAHIVGPDGSTAFDDALNDGSACSAGQRYNLSWTGAPPCTFTLRVATATKFSFIEVDELRQAIAIAGRTSSSSTLNALMTSISAGSPSAGNVPSATSSSAVVWTGTTIGHTGVGTGGSVVVTNSITIDSSYAGKLIIVTGTSVTITLPTASAGGGPYTIVCENSGTTKVQTSAAGQLIFFLSANTASGGYIQSVVQHSTFTLGGASATQWIPLGWDGTWTRDGA